MRVTAGGNTVRLTRNGSTVKIGSVSQPRFSGLPFKSLAFGDIATAETLGDLRQRPVDGLSYFPPRQSWADLSWNPGGFGNYIEQGKMVIYTIPHAPESEGAAMNNKGAADDYQAEQVALGTELAAQGLNSPLFVIRLDWEFNGDWSPWSYLSPGGAPALKQAIINCINNLRAGGLTQVKFDLCVSREPDHSPLIDVFPGSQYIDIIGVDQYDWWNPSFSEADWAQEQSELSVLAVADFAESHGIKWALDEGANVHESLGQSQGGDNPFWWQKMWEFMVDRADSCSHHVTYDDAGTDLEFKHDFASNPDSFAYYSRADRWGGNMSAYFPDGLNLFHNPQAMNAGDMWPWIYDSAGAVTAGRVSGAGVADSYGYRASWTGADSNTVSVGIHVPISGIVGEDIWVKLWGRSSIARTAQLRVEARDDSYGIIGSWTSDIQPMTANVYRAFDLSVQNIPENTEYIYAFIVSPDGAAVGVSIDVDQATLKTV